MRKYRNAASDYEYGAMLGENLNFAASEAYKLLRTNLDFALSDEQKTALEKRLLDTTGYVQFEMHYDVDASLLGGMVIRIGDRVVDSSIKTRLYGLKKELSALQLA